MSRIEDEGVTANKKFKISAEKKDLIFGENKNNILSINKTKTEAGSYFLGPIVKKYARTPVTQYLARKKGTDDYYLMKMLTLDDSDSTEKCSYAKRSFFHNEYSILSLLKNHPGVIQLHDFFKDYSCGDGEDSGENSKVKHVCMVLECLIHHGYHNTEWISLNHYLKEDRLSETEALYIFHNLLLVIKDLHLKNIVLRDLRLSNIMLNRRTLKVKLTDFYYAKLVPSDSGGSLYLSQDKLSTQLVMPKPCDMWSAGVVFYAMLTGCMPFAGTSYYGASLYSNRSVRDLYLKIMKNDYIISNNVTTSERTKDILRGILCKVPHFRLNASEAVDMVAKALALQFSSQNPSALGENEQPDQTVPECPDLDSKDEIESKAPANLELLRVFSETKKTMDFGKNSKNAKENVCSAVEDGTERLSQSFPISSKSSPTDEPLNNKKIKFAMLRLGATSINSINALSFNYSKRNSCLS